MMTIEDLKRIELPDLDADQIRRISNAETSCKKAETNWSKTFWFNTFKKLCEKYNAMSYFRNTIH